MPRLRLFILWIVFVCVPLQGYAAAAMAFCGPGHAGGEGRAVAALAADPAQANPHGHVDHAAHAESRGLSHPVAGSTAVHDAGQSHDLQPRHAGASPAGTHADADDGASHACGTCAACHAAALTGRLDVAILHDLPPVDLAEPALVPATRVPRLLDRPPRA